MNFKQADWETWLANPITEAFLAAVEGVRDKAKDDWDAVSWDNERMWADDNARSMRTACRSRFECAEDILNISFEEQDDEEH